MRYSYINLLFVLGLVLGLSSNTGCHKEKKYTVYGIITDASNNQPLSGAKVSMSLNDARTTGNDGQYKFEGVVAMKKYLIQVEKNNYQYTSKEVFLYEQDLKIDFTLIH